jgi:hypothetical protein
MLAVAIGAVALAGIAWALFAGGDSNRIAIETASGSHIFTVEWARTPAERARGLMERTDLPADHGMVFDFGREQPVSFWMRNTPLPLDMIFIHGDGTVYRIEHSTTPYSDDMIPSGGAVRYVLEVNGGTAMRIGLRPGDRVRLTPPSAPAGETDP